MREQKGCLKLGKLGRRAVWDKINKIIIQRK